MYPIDAKRFGLAVGATLTLLYLGCMFFMATAGDAAIILLFNSLLHGFDVTSIMRVEVPLWEAAFGLVATFLLGWIAGMLTAGIYNLSLRIGK